MDVRAQIQSLIRHQHTNTTLAAAAGLSLVAAGRYRFVPPANVQLRTFEKLVKACGYELVLVKKDVTP